MVLTASVWFVFFIFPERNLFSYLSLLMFKIEKKYTGLFIVIDVHDLVHLLLVSFFLNFFFTNNVYINQILN
jgi:hypothetical protein